MNEFELATQDAIDLLALIQNNAKKYFPESSNYIVHQHREYLVKVTAHAIGHLVCACIQREEELG